jgi:hypothetical protein
MRLAAVLVAIAQAGSTALLARAPVPLTKITVRSMPDQVLTRRIFGDLGRIMRPLLDRGQPGVRPTRPLGRLSFMTIPHASDVAGLCESLWVEVGFEPAGPLSGANTHVRPNGFTEHTIYLVGDLPRLLNLEGAEDDERPRLDARCAGIDPRSVSTIAASDGEVAARAVRLVEDLLGAARAGRPVAALVCENLVPPGEPPLAPAACLQFASRLRADNVFAVYDCTPPPPGHLVLLLRQQLRRRPALRVQAERRPPVPDCCFAGDRHRRPDDRLIRARPRLLAGDSGTRPDRRSARCHAWRP